MVARIRLDSCATMSVIGPLYEQVLQALSDQPDLEIDASEVADIDLSLIQLIESARALAAREGKAVSLTNPANPVLAELLERAGFLTAPTAENINFWFHGELTI